MNAVNFNLTEIGRKKFEEYAKSVQAANGSPFTTSQFAVSDNNQTGLMKAIFDQSSFLKRINNELVLRKNGAKLHTGFSGFPLGRTDTSDGTTQNQITARIDPSDVGYETKDVDANFLRTFMEIDNWAHLQDFASFYRSQFVQNMSNAIQWLAWNGLAEYGTTLPENNGLDVLKGFPQKLKEELAANFLEEIVNASGQITIAESSADFKSADALVLHMQGLIPDRFRSGSTDRTKLRVYTSYNMADKLGLKIYDAFGSTPSEKVLAQLSLTTLGGREVVIVDGFPPQAICLTYEENLSYYTLRGSMRRTLNANDPSRKGFIDWNYWQSCFVVENPEAMVFAKNVLIDGENKIADPVLS
jgi:P2 family phage major capsid protein